MAEKKKILFINIDLKTGGVTKSLTSLMNVIDREKYDVSLFVLNPEGAFRSLLPKDLNIITFPEVAAYTNRISGLKQLIKSGHPILASKHLIRLIVSRFSKAESAMMLARLMPEIKDCYDTVVDFGGQTQLYYMVDKLKAKKKITFFHNDYSKWPYYYKIDKKYYSKVDKIFTVSEHCVKVMKDWFPEYSDKIDLMENISAIQVISKMAKEPIDVMREEIPMILSVGHICERKGSGLAIETASLLKHRGIIFHWYFVGDNPDEGYYRNLLRKYNVEDCISFLGIKVNPYPYIKKATIMVHPAKFEGKSIALDEMKLLCKPVVVTNFSTVNDQFKDNYNASICEMNPSSLATSIEELLSSEEKQKLYSDNLKKDLKDNLDEIKKLYRIFDL